MPAGYSGTPLVKKLGILKSCFGTGAGARRFHSSAAPLPVGGAHAARLRLGGVALCRVWQAATSDRIDHPGQCDRSHPVAPEARRASPTHPAGACSSAARTRVLILNSPQNGCGQASPCGPRCVHATRPASMTSTRVDRRSPFPSLSSDQSPILGSRPPHCLSGSAFRVSAYLGEAA